MTAYHSLNASALHHGIPAGAVLLDVRTAMEHDEKHLCCPHIHTPLDQLEPAAFLVQHGLHEDTPLYLLCLGGKRAAEAAARFAAVGCTRLHVIEGGLRACESCGLALSGYAVKPPGKKPLSLERQVRIAAGGMAALGAALGLTLHPLFGLIPLLIGGGLVFAGITDCCGLALVLAKAPWNIQTAST